MHGIFYSPGRPCRVLASSMWSNNIPKATLSWRLVSVFWVRSHRCYGNASRRYTQQPKNTPMQGIFYSPGRPCRVLASSMWSNNATQALLGAGWLGCCRYVGCDLTAAMKMCHTVAITLTRTPNEAANSRSKASSGGSSRGSEAIYHYWLGWGVAWASEVPLVGQQGPFLAI